MISAQPEPFQTSAVSNAASITENTRYNVVMYLSVARAPSMTDWNGVGSMSSFSSSGAVGRVGSPSRPRRKDMLGTKFCATRVTTSTIPAAPDTPRVSLPASSAVARVNTESTSPPVKTSAASATPTSPSTRAAAPAAEAQTALTVAVVESENTSGNSQPNPAA